MKLKGVFFGSYTISLLNHVFYDQIRSISQMEHMYLSVAQLKLNELNSFDYNFGFHEHNQLINKYFSIDQLTCVLGIKKRMDIHLIISEGLNLN